MELAAWENGKPYVPSDLARKYDTHNKLNIYTYLATHLKVLTKHFEYEKLSQHFFSLTNEWLGKLIISLIVQDYISGKKLVDI